MICRNYSIISDIYEKRDWLFGDKSAIIPIVRALLRYLQKATASSHRRFSKAGENGVEGFLRTNTLPVGVDHKNL
jgi:hypothetical protein